ncbi:cytotoxic translational repressor of toxin-antitoxin stability system [Geomonas sp. RF6]|uniref:type II toxin-antitoxin system RelE family toxin n=1 Tax=Geomonas sp. RF6 TaxID=2897342 RepID=UPI001E4911A7|nr:cytotoxic translational repressor of toxin-antitoxin stability system [Geomonas sp. RF6]UFS69313.1 cytotoxic translational repressor of toxin-antitoxin stability system [Geomonas sp. RF6]
MPWTVKFTRQAEKQAATLPKKLRAVLALLAHEIETDGPVRGNWPNYGKLSKTRHHCHLKKGKPTYVAVWEVVDGQIRLVEVTYVGTHEKAPY